jgi:single stranded DNA-binding protein
MNEIKLDGRVGKMYGLKYTASGIALLSFSLANWKPKGNSTGVTSWFKVSAWREVAEEFQNLRPGDKIEVFGDVEIKTWTAKDGAERTGVEVTAKSIKLLQEAKPKEEAVVPGWHPPDEQKTVILEFDPSEELPF